MSSSRPRVVRLITRLNVGGPARQALLLTRDLAPTFDTMLAAGRPTLVEGEMSDEAVTVRRVPLVRPTDPVNDSRALVAVRNLLSRAAPALLHTHMAKAGTIGRAAALSLTNRPRTVHTSTDTCSTATSSRRPSGRSWRLSAGWPATPTRSSP